MKVRFKKLCPDAIIPARATPEAAGLDLYSCEKRFIGPGRTMVVSTGVAMELPWGYEGQVRSRSGLAAKESIHVLNSPGTIDSDYRGPIMVILHNSSNTRRVFEVGDRIAQLVIAPVTMAEPEEVVELTDTPRGGDGLGSTGV